jgi:hypothetical protein
MNVSDIGALADWLTKREAAAAIGVSTKAIERFAAARKLEQRSRPQARGPAVAVYHPQDVARLAAERRTSPPAPFVVPDGAPPVSGKGDGIADRLAIAGSPVGGDDALQRFATALVRAVGSQTSETWAPMSQTLFVTITQAAAVSGLSSACLRRLIADGTLKALKDRGWRIRRRDLEML